jgi:hypothetical protein
MMDLLAEPYTPDGWESPTQKNQVVARGGAGLWMPSQMAFSNWRLIGFAEADDPEEQDYSFPLWGWCFRGELALMAALEVWRPEVEDEPMGWHKRSGEPRRAPLRDQAPEINQPRCAHGSYLISGMKCAQSPHCVEFRVFR